MGPPQPSHRKGKLCALHLFCLDGFGCKGWLRWFFLGGVCTTAHNLLLFLSAAMCKVTARRASASPLSLACCSRAISW